MINNEDMNQVLNNTQNDVFRDLRVASQGYVMKVYDKQVDVQLSICDVVDGVPIQPPVVKNLFVVGSEMPQPGTVGVVLHLDRRNQIWFPPRSDNDEIDNDKIELPKSGGPAHEIGYGVFLPIVQ